MYAFRHGLGDAVSSAASGAAALSVPFGAVGSGIASSNWANCIGWASYFNPGCYFSGPSPSIAPPPAPSGPVLTTPPASGEDAAALAQSLSDQQMAAQQALAGSQVKSSLWDQIAGGAYEVGDTVNPFSNPSGGLSWLSWAVIGVGAFALVMVSGGRGRR